MNLRQIQLTNGKKKINIFDINNPSFMPGFKPSIRLKSIIKRGQFYDSLHTGTDFPLQLDKDKMRHWEYTDDLDIEDKCHYVKSFIYMDKKFVLVYIPNGKIYTIVDLRTFSNNKII